MQYIVDSIFNKTNALLKETGVDIALDHIEREIGEIYNGKAIKIMDSISTCDTACFVLKNKTYMLVVNCDDEAKTVDISNDMFIDLMANFYSCRALSLDFKDHSKQILELSRRNDLIIRKLTIESSNK